MNEELLDIDESIFLSYEQESDWKRRWLQQKIRILEIQLKNLSLIPKNRLKKPEDDSRLFECCSRAKPPPSFIPPCVTLYPISQPFLNPANLINSSFAPITPICKIDDVNLPLDDSDSDSYFRDDHPIIYDFSKEETANANLNSPLTNKPTQVHSSPTQPLKNKPSQLNSIEIHPVSKFTPKRTYTKNLIPTPEWTQCDHLTHSIDDSSPSLNNELDSFESRSKRAHIDIEIIQRRIRKHQLNIPIEEVNSHDFVEFKIIPTNKEKKLDKKYRKRVCQNQIPPNWEPRSYDNQDDMLSEKEIEIWTKLMKNELSKESISDDALNSGLKLKHIHIRSSDSFPIENNPI